MYGFFSHLVVVCPLGRRVVTDQVRGCQAGDKKTLVQLPSELCPLSTFLDVLVLPPPTEGSAPSSESAAAQPAGDTSPGADKSWSLSSWWSRLMTPAKEKEGEDTSGRHIRKSVQKESQEKQQNDDGLLWGIRPEVLLSAAEFR